VKLAHTASVPRTVCRIAGWFCISAPCTGSLCRLPNWVAAGGDRQGGMEASPSPVYGARLLSGFGLIPIASSNLAASANMDGPSTLGCGAFQVQAFFSVRSPILAKAIFHEPRSWCGSGFPRARPHGRLADRSRCVLMAPGCNSCCPRDLGDHGCCLWVRHLGHPSRYAGTCQMGLAPSPSRGTPSPYPQARMLDPDAGQLRRFTRP
jgi:hypothetical protein